MAAQDRNATLAQLADEAAGLVSVERKSPKVDLWKRKTRDFVGREYGAEFVEILNRALRFGRVVTSDSEGQLMHHEAMLWLSAMPQGQCQTWRFVVTCSGSRVRNQPLRD